MNTSANRRPAVAEPVDRATPPPLQQPDQHGRRQDPAAEAWLPESTLDPATRAWLTGEDRRRSGSVAPVPVQTPDSFAPRSAPTHVHGAGSGLDSWAGVPDAGQGSSAARDRGVPEHAEPTLDPDAFPAEQVAPEDDPEVTRLAPRSGGPAPAHTSLPPVPRVESAEPVVPFWAAAPEAAAPAPSAPSWWIGRAGEDLAGEGTAADETTKVGLPSSGAGAGAGVGAGGVVADAPRDPAAADAPPADGDADTGAQSAATPSSVVDPASSDTAQSGTTERSDPGTPRPGDTAVVEPLVDRRPPRPTPLVQPGTHPTTCHVCGHQLEPDDIFCNECGAVRPAVTAAFTGPVVPLPVARPDWAARATSADEPDDVAEPEAATDAVSTASDDGSQPAVVSPPAPDDGSQDVPATDDALAADGPEATTPGDGAPADDHGDQVDLHDHEVPPTDDVPAGPSASEEAPGDGAPAPTAAPLPPIPGMPGPVLPSPSAPSIPSSGDADEAAQLDEDDDEDVEDVDQTRIVTKTPTRAPFLLHCSTGERLGVHGTGLLGRLPRPQPGERFDDLLTIHDPGKSVSKTHLEIGRDGDDLWVSDRFSGNGSVIRHIDGSIRRCEPGRRYRVERGARVDIGEQFFLVQ